MRKAIKQSTTMKIMVVITIFLLAATVVSITFTQILNGQLSNAHNNKTELILQAKNFSAASGYLTEKVRYYASTAEKQAYDDYWYEVNTAKRRENAIAAMKQIGLTTEEEEYIVKMGDVSNNLIPLESQAMDLAGKGNRDSAQKVVYGTEYNAGVDEMSALYQKFYESLTKRTDTLINDINIKQISLLIFSFVACLSLVVIQIITFTYVFKKLIKPILIIKDNMGTLEKGNLSDKLPLEPDTSEIGELTNSIINVRAFLEGIITDISERLELFSSGDFDFKDGENYAGDFDEIKNSFEKISDKLSGALHNINLAANNVASSADKFPLLHKHYHRVQQSRQHLLKSCQQQSAI